MPANISNIPAELLIQILGDVPMVDASSILRVSREWYYIYRALIKRGFPQLFDLILFSNTEHWNIPTRMLPYFKFNRFIKRKLHSLCKSFSMQLGAELWSRKQALDSRKKELEKEETEIEKLLDDYEDSFEYDGWFPDELWKRRQKNRTAICINTGSLGKVKAMIAIYHHMI